MKLIRFRVTDFRSVDDSGWIEVDRVAALIGTNESGKTNLLLPLWKLNPAKGGEIDPTADYPRKRYNQIRTMTEKPVFITADFELSDEEAQPIAKAANATLDDVRIARVTRTFDPKDTVQFLNAKVKRDPQRAALETALSTADAEIARLEVPKNAEALTALMRAAIADARKLLPATGDVPATVVAEMKTRLDAISLDQTPQRNPAVPHFETLRENAKRFAEDVSKSHPPDAAAATELVLKALPHFVYYASYGNLDSEIYLPHVIENLTRPDLGQKEEAKARTLKVLFEFVKLKPEEIQGLGRDPQVGREPTDEEIAAAALRRKERDILLQSAGTELTDRFRDWWKQGTYRFRFQADGDHFRIWVSDDKRPEDIELEGRSAGLQWFLSFYLVFLVESEDTHEDSILLLDEPGHSLHPIAQKDLSKFFDNLAESNQLLYTSHSPFLLDYDRLDRVRTVFVKDNGTTGVSEDLRAGATIPQAQSVYSAHAAMGLSVSDTLLLGCRSTVCEGVSDQTYLSTMKTLLIAAGRIKPSREMVFFPAWGVRGVKAVVSIVAAKDEALPPVLHDGDVVGAEFGNALRKGPYNATPERVISVGDFVKTVPEPEIEDMMPRDIVADAATRWLLRSAEDDFHETVVDGVSIVTQIEEFAETYGIRLETPGWKVELAKRVKARLLSQGHERIDSAMLGMWQALFERLLA